MPVYLNTVKFEAAIGPISIKPGTIIMATFAQSLQRAADKIGLAALLFMGLAVAGAVAGV